MVREGNTPLPSSSHEHCVESCPETGHLSHPETRRMTASSQTFLRSVLALSLALAACDSSPHSSSKRRAHAAAAPGRDSASGDVAARDPINIYAAAGANDLSPQA